MRLLSINVWMGSYWIQKYINNFLFRDRLQERDIKHCIPSQQNSSGPLHWTNRHPSVIGNELWSLWIKIVHLSVKRNCPNLCGFDGHTLGAGLLFRQITSSHKLIQSGRETKKNYWHCFFSSNCFQSTVNQKSFWIFSSSSSSNDENLTGQFWSFFGHRRAEIGCAPTSQIGSYRIQPIVSRLWP